MRHTIWNRGRLLGVFFVVVGLVATTSSMLRPPLAMAAPAPNRLVYVVQPDPAVPLVDVREWDGGSVLPRTLLSLPLQGDGTKPSLSPDGRYLAYSSGFAIGLYDLIGGAALAGYSGVAVLSAPAWSHDGTRLAFAAGDWDTAQLYTVGVGVGGVDTAGLHQVAAHIGADGYPSWSGDDTQLVYSHSDSTMNGSAPIHVYRMSSADGSGAVQLTSGPGLDYWPSYLDSGRVVFDRLSGSRQLMTVSAQDGSGLAQLVQPEASDWNVTVAADGALVAYGCGQASGGTHLCLLDLATGARLDATATYGIDATNPLYAPTLRSTVPPPALEPLHVVVMGDSVASGEGIGYEPSWKLDKNARRSWVLDNPVGSWQDDGTPGALACHRSPQAYGQQVATALGAKQLVLACTGASAGSGVLRSQLFADGTQTPAQLGTSAALYSPPNPAYDAFKPDVVLLTLGADDIRFDQVLLDCYTPKVVVGRLCESNATMRIALARQAAGLDAVLAEIVRRGQSAGKVPRVFVTGYFDPFGPVYASCVDIRLVGPAGLSRLDIEWLRYYLKLLNKSIAGTAGKYSNVKFVDVAGIMAGHEFCSSDPWVYGASIRLASQLGGSGYLSNNSPYHPNQNGQRAIAAKIVILT
jgi:Tol biopolymer transport system component